MRTLAGIRILVTKENRFWFAQGLELDYCSQGDSEEDAKNSFVKGLVSTIREHLRVFGKIDGLLKAAPQELFAEFLTRTTEGQFGSAQVSTYEIADLRIPIAFFVAREAGVI